MLRKISARFILLTKHKSVEYGIGYAEETTRQLTRSDCDECDLSIGTDRANTSNICRICGDDVGGKKRLLMNHSVHGDVADCGVRMTIKPLSWMR